MSENNNPSKTILLITVAVAVLLIVVVWPLSMLGKGSSTPTDADEAELRTGEAIYASVCKACHETGVAGAPKTGDKAAWAPRIASGMAAMLKSAANGKGAMPARGGAPDLSDDELKAAVAFLTGKAK